MANNKLEPMEFKLITKIIYKIFEEEKYEKLKKFIVDNIDDVFHPLK